MILYKNVGIEDLEKILKEGILPISKTENDNWGNNRRAPNSKDVVYLFLPKKRNYMPNYGLVLLEVDVEYAVKTTFAVGDNNADNYDEYIIDQVRPEQIKNIYIPEIFKNRKIEDMPENIKRYILQENNGIVDTLKNYLSDETFKKIIFVKCSATISGLPATKEELLLFGQTAKINSSWFGYFRGLKNPHEYSFNEWRCEVLDVDDVDLVF